MIVVNTNEEAKKLVEARELELLRSQTALDSLKDASERMEAIELGLATAIRLVSEVWAQGSECENADFETQIAIARDEEKLERQFERLDRQWHCQRKRVEWENRQAANRPLT